MAQFINKQKSGHSLWRSHILWRSHVLWRGGAIGSRQITNQTKGTSAQSFTNQTKGTSAQTFTNKIIQP